MAAVSTDSEIAAYIRGLRLRREQEYARRVWYWKRGDTRFEPLLPEKHMAYARSYLIKGEILRLMEEVA